MNWGTKIIIGLAVFMTFIVVLGLLMVNSKKDALVDNDYYEKGIAYNKDYDRKEQVNTDHAKPEINITSTAIVLTFKQSATGTIKLMRTADKTLDQVVSFETDSANRVKIPSSALIKGSWRLIADWTSEEKTYLYQQEITIK